MTKPQQKEETLYGVRVESKKDIPFLSEHQYTNEVKKKETGAICGDGMCPYVPCKDFPKCKHVENAIKEKEQKETCPMCYGDGKLHRRNHADVFCMHCNGTGKIYLSAQCQRGIKTNHLDNASFSPDGSQSDLVKEFIKANPKPEFYMPEDYIIHRTIANTPVFIREYFEWLGKKKGGK